MTYYDVDLSQIDSGDATEFLQGIDVGSKSCNVTFSWDNTIQEQYNAYINTLKVSVSSDPIISTDGTINRDYSYIDYYLSIDKNNIQDWILQNTELPSSLRGLTIIEQINTVQERITLCETLNTILEQYKIMLTWYISIVFEGEQIQGTVIPGGIYTNKEGTFSLEVRSDRESIGQSDLPYVVFRIGVDE